MMKTSSKIKSKNKNKWPYAFVSPFVIFFVLTALIPIIVSFFFSFMQIGTEIKWIGLKNYVDMIRDPLFFQSYFNILIIMVFTIPITLLLSLFFAVLLNNAHLKGKGFFRTVYYIPTVTSMVAVASIFLSFFDPTGILNKLLAIINIDPIPWLTHPIWLRISMGIVKVWRGIGYNTILFLTGLQGLNKDIYESAEIDGASKVRQFFNITIPMLKPVVLLALVLSTIGDLATFELPNIFFGSSNGPENAAVTVGVNIYSTAFESINFGKASAIAWTLVFISFVISIIQMKLGGKDNEK